MFCMAKPFPELRPQVPGLLEPEEIHPQHAAAGGQSDQRGRDRRQRATHQRRRLFDCCYRKIDSRQRRRRYQFGEEDSIFCSPSALPWTFFLWSCR